jgi:tRNA pseudouridine38-40 synthase
VTKTPARKTAESLLQRLPRKRRDKPPPIADAARRFRAVVAYDGTPYAGFQRQRDHVTVQEILEACIESATCLPVTIFGAGRTDAGVHAEGQVVSFDSTTALPASALRHLCDHMLPEDVKVHRLEEAPADFDPQRHCVRKLYRYAAIELPRPSPRLRHFAWQLERELDLDAMRAGAARLVGTHDFKAFRSDPGPSRRDFGTTRTVERIDVERRGECVGIDVVGPGFLYMMVRNIAAALVAVGLGERTPSWVGEVLASRDRRRAVPPAPAHGLTLVSVDYADGFGLDGT